MSVLAKTDNGRHLLDNERVEVGILSKGGLWRNGQVLLLVFTIDWVLVTEDEVQLDNKKFRQRKMTTIITLVSP